MKKKYLFLSLLIAFINNTVAQIPEQVIDVPSPRQINFHNDDLYIVPQDRISKINVNEINPTISDLFIGTSPVDLLVNNDNMFVADSNLGKVYKVDVSNEAYESIDIIVNSQPNTLAINGNDLYIRDSNFPQMIFKQNFTNLTSATSIEFTDIFISNLIFETYGMFGFNDELFLGQTDPDLIFIKFSKISTLFSPAVTMPSVVAGDLNSIPRKFAIKDNYLYAMQINQIIKIDLTAPQPTGYSVVTTEVNNPEGIAINGCNLYISDTGNNRITKLNICNLNTVENELKQIRLYPNPAKDKINVSGITELKKYKIFSTLGVLVSEGSIKNNERIDIQNLENNLYLIKFENENTLKFIKE